MSGLQSYGWRAGQQRRLRPDAHNAIVTPILAAKEHDMPRSLIFALTTTVLLSACAGQIVGPPPAPVYGGTYSTSVGFAGLGGDNATLRTARQETAKLALVRTSGTATSPVALQTSTRIPQISVRGGSSNRSVQAARAIRSGGTLDSNSVPVNVAGRDLRLSIVAVGGNQFAVFRAPGRGLVSMGPNTVSNLLAGVPALTGCTPEGGGYSFGPSRARATGIAGAINCS